jgi:hypothetical protein
VQEVALDCRLPITITNRNIWNLILVAGFEMCLKAALLETGIVTVLIDTGVSLRMDLETTDGGLTRRRIREIRNRQNFILHKKSLKCLFCSLFLSRNVMLGSSMRKNGGGIEASLARHAYQNAKHSMKTKSNGFQEGGNDPVLRIID